MGVLSRSLFTRLIALYKQALTFTKSNRTQISLGYVV